jgi:hypothetical protein
MEEIYDTIFTDYHIFVELIMIFTIFICLLICLYKNGVKERRKKKLSIYI